MPCNVCGPAVLALSMQAGRAVSLLFVAAVGNRQ